MAAIVEVLRSHDVFRLVGDFQDGIYSDLRERFAERYDTIIPSNCRSRVHTLPPTFRTVPRLDPPRQVDMDKLFLTLHHRDRRFALHLAILEGQLPLVRHILKCRPKLLSSDALYCAVLCIQVDTVYESFPLTLRLPYGLKNSMWYRREGLIDLAARVNSLPLVQFFHGQRFNEGLDDSTSSAAMDSAAAHGNLEMVVFLHENCPEGCSYRAVTAAIEGGHQTVLVFLVDHYIHLFSQSMDVTEIFKAAGASGQLDIVQLICQAFPDNSTTSMAEAAAIHGHVHVLEWLHEHRGELGDFSWGERIIKAGHVNVLKWLVQVHRPSTADFAVVKSSRYKYGQPIPGRFEMPIRVHQVELVEFLHRVGYSLDIIHPSSLPVLEFMHKVAGMPLRSEYVFIAFCGYFFRGAALLMIDTHMEEARQIIDGYFEIVKYMHAQPDNDFCFSINDMAFASAVGSLDVVKFLHENRQEGCTTKAMDVACTNGHLGIVKFLFEHRKERCSSRALSQAIYCGHLNIVKFLLENIHDIEWDSICNQNDDRPLKGIHADMLEYLVAHGAELNVHYEVLFDEAVQCGRLDLVNAVVSSGLPLYSRYHHGLVTAMTNYDPHMVSFLWSLAKQVWSDFELKELDHFVARCTGSVFSSPWDAFCAELERFQCKTSLIGV
ncbi:hypothetical protein AeMF1_015478 [Aphanomyces euteiches]|nr:hypothetical protein AeMF1_015478 [Aphanomyces euteiches]KAH9184301.1 hypothetical protein AeNC1_013724 [Aphanomyces euteiches]